MTSETKPRVASDATLKVVEARSVDDVGKGRIRLPVHVRIATGWTVGDHVVVEGPKGMAGAIVWRWPPEDEPGQDLVAMDGIMRDSVGVGISDPVKLVHATGLPTATRVRLVPLLDDEVVFPDGVDGHVRVALHQRPVVRGEKLVVPGIAAEGKAVVWLVRETEPSAAVVVAADATQVEVVRPPRQFRMLGVSQQAGLWRLWFYAVGDKEPRGLPVTAEQAEALKQQGVTEFEEDDAQQE